MKKLFIFLFLLGGFYFAGEAQAATFFIDFGCNTPGNGSTATCNGDADDSFGSIDTFADAARTAGDIAWVRRGTASTTNITDVTFTSDGTLNNPITLSADYDNLWSEFASSTQTYTVTFGSKTMEASASISDIAANDWIYVGNDHNPNAASPSVYGKDYAYEVASVSGTTLTLYLPYKGPSSGAGLQLRIMPDAPIWNATNGDFQFTMSTDLFWYISGLDIRSTDSACSIQPVQSNVVLRDLVLQGDGTTDCAISGLNFNSLAYKIRTFGQVSAFLGVNKMFLSDFLVNCNSVASSRFLLMGGAPVNLSINNGEIVNCTNDFVGASIGNLIQSVISSRNLVRTGTLSTVTGISPATFYFEDSFGIVGENSLLYTFTNADTNATTTIRSTAVLRTGGGTSSQLVLPPSGTANTGISTRTFPVSFIKLFEYPVYADDSSKTYSIYFNSTSTGHWTADPTASEFWIECEYYNESSGADRILKKSTDTINFAGITTWDSLDVTCDPTQSGILYLRGWYGKPRETNTDDTNTFYMDVQPVIQ